MSVLFVRICIYPKMRGGSCFVSEYEMHTCLQTLALIYSTSYFLASLLSRFLLILCQLFSSSVSGSQTLLSSSPIEGDELQRITDRSLMFVSHICTHTISATLMSLSDPLCGADWLF